MAGLSGGGEHQPSSPPAVGSLVGEAEAWPKETTLHKPQENTTPASVAGKTNTQCQPRKNKSASPPEPQPRTD